MMTVNLIPGASWLGAGLSVYDMHNPGRLARRLFDLGTSSPHTVGSQTFGLPSNVTFQSGVGTSKYTAKTFRDEAEFSADYRARAKVSGEAGIGSGSLQVKWEQLTSNRSDRAVVDVATIRTSYELELTHRSPDTLASDVLADPLFKDLPDVFTADTRHAFFAFFRRYGTHYVSTVELGGELHYYCIIDSSKASDEVKIEAEAKCEYGKAFGVDAGASGVTLDKDWATSREVQIESRPASDISTGDTAGTPQLADSAGYKAWILASEEDPAVLDFELVPVSELFTGPKRDALDNAAREFTQSQIYASTTLPASSSYPGSISLSGQQLEPSNTKEAAASGPLRAWQVVVDRRGLTVKLSKLYSYGYLPKPRSSGDMLADLTPFLDDPNYIVVLTTFVNSAYAGGQRFIVTSDIFDAAPGVRSPRQKQYMDILRSMGAGSEFSLATTIGHGIPTSDAPGDSWGYAFIGVSGGGPMSRDCAEVCSHEKMSTAPTTDALLVLLEPQDQDASGQVTYTPIFDG